MRPAGLPTISSGLNPWNLANPSSTQVTTFRVSVRQTMEVFSGNGFSVELFSFSNVTWLPSLRGDVDKMGDECATLRGGCRNGLPPGRGRDHPPPVAHFRVLGAGATAGEN